MGFYAHYTDRPRNRLGRHTKLYQAEKIFRVGVPSRDLPRSILEIGPGDGYIAQLASDAGCTYLGLEASESVAEKLLAQGLNIRAGAVPPLPSDLGRYHVCFMLHVIEHMKDMDTATFLLREIRRHLHDGGRAVIACPDYVRWGRHFYDCDYTHSLPFTRRRLRQLLQNEGFDISHDAIYVGPLFSRWGLPVYWLAKMLSPQVLDDITYPYLKTDTLRRGFWTFLPNLLVVGTKRA